MDGSIAKYGNSEDVFTALSSCMGFSMPMIKKRHDEMMKIMDKRSRAQLNRLLKDGIEYSPTDACHQLHSTDP